MKTVENGVIKIHGPVGRGQIYGLLEYLDFLEIQYEEEPTADKTSIILENNTRIEVTKQKVGWNNE